MTTIDDMPKHSHEWGQTTVNRIIGATWWSEYEVCLRYNAKGQQCPAMITRRYNMSDNTFIDQEIFPNSEVY